MRIGRRLAVDYGSVRIGLALSDPQGILASPLTGIKRAESLVDTVQTVKSVADENDVFEIYVGDPVSMSGTASQSTIDARLFAVELGKTANQPVRLIDERLTTVSAAQRLRQSGKDSRQARRLIDSASAVEILEQALSTERSTGFAPGKLAGDIDV